jgi:fructose 1,6-bisphosphate aldolase/phosphatase
MKTTISIIKADVGSYCGHQLPHPNLLKIAKSELEEAKKSGILIDYYVANCGDDIDLIMTHDKGDANSKVHKVAWDAFVAATEEAKKLKLYGAGQDLLSDAFSGNVKGLGPGSAEMTFEERKSEPVVCFLMDKTDPGAFNLPVYKMFADPFTTAGLIIDPNMHGGFTFEVYDIEEHKRVLLHTPTELYDLLALIGSTSRYVIKRVFPGKGNKVPEKEPAACVSTDKLFQIAGEYVGKDDPVAMARGQSGLPSVGELVEPYAFPHLVSGWMRGSHVGPILPCSMKDAIPTRFDGPPRIVALGFQLCEGKLIGPNDIFADIAYDHARSKALKIADYMRRHGPFQPHRLPPGDMEYTSMPEVMEKLKGRFEALK